LTDRSVDGISATAAGAAVASYGVPVNRVGLIC